MAFTEDSGSKSESESESPFLQKHSSRVIIKSLGLEKLPSDIIFNILLRLPLKSLLQCRGVCKTLRTIVDSPRFTRLHLTSPLAASVQELRRLTLFCDNGETKTFISLKKDDKRDILSRGRFPTVEIANAGTFSVEALGFGLFCFKDTCRQGQVFLFNPLRGEILMLPPPPPPPPPPVGSSPFSPFSTGSFVEFYGLGYDNTEETFKLVRVFSHSPCVNFSTDVYTLGTSSWRAIPAVPPHLITEWSSVSAYGDVHWKMKSCRPDENVESMIITFDTRKEEFKFTPHPDFRPKHYIYFHLLDWKGSLAMVDFSLTTHIDIWLLKDYSKKEWAREYRIGVEMWLTEQRAKLEWPTWLPEHVRTVGVWKDGLIFQFSMGRCFYYNTKTNRLRFMEAQYVTYTNRTLCNYTGSLVSLKNYGKVITREAGHGNYFDLGTASMVSTFKSVKI